MQDCEANTIIAGALLGESLKLTPSPQLGQYYLVPFKQKAKYDRSGNLIQPESSKATFILGYKGYIQLAIRSGQYKRIVVKEIKAGELVRYDPLDEEIEVHMIDNFDEREAAETIGYYAMFEYLNGFRKSLYWSKEKMLSHADHYSKAFSRKAYEDIQAGKISERDMWKYSSFWYTDFDGMACKTMLRQLLSKWGVLSIDMEKAMEHDGEVAAVGDNGQIFTEAEPLSVPDTFPEEELPAQANSDEPVQLDLNEL